MKLLLITTDITIFGGIERVISKITLGLIEKFNYDIEIISLYHNDNNLKKTSFEFNKKIKFTYLEMENNKRKSKNKIHSLIIVLNNYLKIKKCIKKILQNRDSDIIMTFHPQISIATILNKRYIKGKLVVTEHSDYDFGLDTITRLLRKKFYKKAEKVVVLTKTNRDRFNSFTNNVIVINNPVSIESNEISKNNFKRIIAVGRLEKVKGFDRAIEIFKLISTKNLAWNMDIIGEGVEKKNLESMINEYNLNERIRIMPFTSNIEEEMLKSDIFILPSRSEAFPMVLLEAMECGLPCISFMNTGANEIISNYENGILVNEGDIEVFSNELSVLMNEFNIRKKLGENAKINASKYHLNNIVNEWDMLFKSL